MDEFCMAAIGGCRDGTQEWDAVVPKGLTWKDDKKLYDVNGQKEWEG